MLTYSISRQTMTSDTRGLIFDRAYSGNGKWINDPSATAVKGHGPLPCGDYRMTEFFTSARTGKGAIRLLPFPSNVMYGRGDFEIHGDNSKGDRSASDGCIVKSPFALRQLAYAEPDKHLRVVP